MNSGSAAAHGGEHRLPPRFMMHRIVWRIYGKENPYVRDEGEESRFSNAAPYLAGALFSQFGRGFVVPMYVYSHAFRTTYSRQSDESSLVPEDALRGKADPNWILFQDPDGKILSVRVEWNLYVPRFRIEEDTAVGIPADVEQYSFVERDFFGQNEIVVDGQNTFSAIKQSGLYRQQSTIQSFHVLAAILLLLLESFVCYGVKRIIRQNPIKKQNQ